MYLSVTEYVLCTMCPKMLYLVSAVDALDILSLRTLSRSTGYQHITTDIPATIDISQPAINQLIIDRCIYHSSTCLILPRPKCPSMLNILALNHIDHRNHRFFRRYLSARNFPCNTEIAHVSVVRLLVYVLFLDCSGRILTSQPLQDAGLV